MLKITSQRDEVLQRIVLQVEGRLAGPWVDELDHCCSEYSKATHDRVVLELTGVTFIDGAGKALLMRLWQEGVELRASGCLNRCVVEEITRAPRQTPSCETRGPSLSRETQDET